MCNFFSCLSDGEGNIRHFQPEDIARIMATGNPKKLNFNSHASIANYYGLDEDKWNKWEFDPVEHQLTLDQPADGLENDGPAVNEKLLDWFHGLDIQSIQTMFYQNVMSAGNDANQTAGDRSTQTAGNDANQTAGNGSTQTAGVGSVQIQRWYDKGWQVATRIVTEAEAGKPYCTDKGAWILVE